MPNHQRDHARPCALLIGTVTSVGQLQAALATLDDPPAVCGCVLPHVPATGLTAAVPVLGSFAELAHVLDRSGASLALVSLPVAMTAQLRDVTTLLDQRKITWRWVPTLADCMAGRTSTVRMAGAPGITSSAIDTVALIGRDPRPLDLDAIRLTLQGKVVMITGAGGSIGSELARLVAGFEPAGLILAERSENALFEIDRQMASRFPSLPRTAVLHDVTDAARTLRLVHREKPNVIFHAAAHKHVPMMEDHPAEAVENNFYGTRSIADAAHATDGVVERFVMISTDKAVNPSSVMGASKRLAELYIQHLGGRSRTLFSMVRFGNVLGSACSVLPIWSQQLAQGLPITVTHPDMHRYFMTIPEAAGLVLQSAAMSGIASMTNQGGEIFLLDMGRPVRVLDLAYRFIRSHGLEPDVDVPIVFTGVRPGEKLFEELAYESEDMLPTPHPSVRIWRMTPPDDSQMTRIVATFDRLRARRTDDDHFWQHAPNHAVLAALRAAVPEMLPQPLAA